MENFYRFTIIHRFSRQKYFVIAISFFEACRILHYPETHCFMQRSDFIAHPNHPPLFHVKGTH